MQSASLSASPASLRWWCKVENSFPRWVQFNVAMPQTPEVYPFNVSFSGYPGPQLETSLLLSFAIWASNAQLTFLNGMVIQICDALLWRQEDFCGREAPETSTLSNSSSELPVSSSPVSHGEYRLSASNQLVLGAFYAGMSMPRDFKAFAGTKVNALLSKNQLYSAWSVIHLLRTLPFRSSSPPVISYKHSHWFFQTWCCSTGNQKIKLRRRDWLGHLPHFQVAARFHFVH